MGATTRWAWPRAAGRAGATRPGALRPGHAAGDPAPVPLEPRGRAGRAGAGLGRITCPRSSCGPTATPTSRALRRGLRRGAARRAARPASPAPATGRGSGAPRSSTPWPAFLAGATSPPRRGGVAARVDAGSPGSRRSSPPSSAALYLLLDPPSADLAAQEYRVDLFAAEGLGLWDNGWYAGHHLPGYSVLFPPLGDLLGRGPRRRAGRRRGRRARRAPGARGLGPGGGPAAGLWFAAATATLLVTGRLTFALGLAVGLGAPARGGGGRPLAGATGRRPALGARRGARQPGGRRCSSPWRRSPGAGRSRRPRRGRRPARWPASPRCRRLPRGRGRALRGLGVLAGAGRDRRRRRRRRPRAPRPAHRPARSTPSPSSRASSWTRRWAATPRAWARSSPGPCWPARRWAPAARGRGPAPSPRSPWRWPTGSGTRRCATGPRAAGDPSVEAAFHAPLLARLEAERARRGPFRLEVPFTENHWEARWIAPRVPLARGWQRQLDVERNPLFYDGRLTPGRLRRWLQDEAVAFVAVPRVDLDRAGRRRPRS